MFADWTTRIAAGELPPAPPRPQGVERNVVITQWDWADPKAYLHDEIATDKRNPTVNANGLLYGAPELSTDNVPVLDPGAPHAPRRSRCPSAIPRRRVPGKPLQPSPYWGDEAIWDSQANMHNPMFDEKGRVWFTSVIRPPDNPAFCKEGSDPSVGQALPGESQRPPARDVRPEDEAVHAHRHLLQHAPPAVRRRRQRHAVDQQRWRRRRGRLAEHEDVRRDARRAEVAGLDRAHPRHQRQRQARRVRRAEPAGRSRARTSASRARSTASRSARPTAPSGARRSASPARDRADRSRPESARDRARRSLRAPRADKGLLAARPRHRPQRRRLDRRSPADTSPASTAASARVR